MSYFLLQGDAVRVPLPDRSVDLVFGSPPYIDCRLYLENGVNLGIARKCPEWVEWMLRVTEEAIRVSRGPVLWVVAGKTEGRNYQPGPEGLLWEWHRRGGYSECPCYWHRSGISGSGGDQWFRKDVEYVLCFKREPKLVFSDNTACGHPPKYAPGGEMSHRTSSGRRVNQWGGNAKSGRSRKKDGSQQDPGRPSHRMTCKSQDSGVLEEQSYVPPAIANPGNLIRTGSGHGAMGHDAAHQSEAPFPEDLAEFFVKSLCPEGGICLDPFSGSGTTVSVADRLGRIGIGLDLRRSQAEIARRRIYRPHAKIHRDRDEPVLPLFASLTEC